MDQTLILLLVFSGLSILPSSLPHQFHFVNLTKNWTEAQRFCRQNYTDLATIDEVMADMKKLKNTEASTAWIGLYNNIWKWSLGDRELEGNGFWDYHHPKNDPNTEFCVYMMLNTTWRSDTCSSTWHFVCYNKTQVTNKYIVIDNFKTWSEAQTYCREKHTDLASVRNTTEMEAIKSSFPNVTGIYRVWIGLKKSPGVWRWSDQSGFSSKSLETFKANMAHGSYQNGEFCGVVTFPSGNWKYQGCTTNSHFICYDDELVLVSENKTWSEALWHCRDLDMELVSAHNQNIQHWVQQRAKKASTPFVWLGLRYTCTLDFWFWVNGEESCYHNWAGREGYNTIKEQCGNTGAIQRDGGQWVGKSETERFNFICSNSTDY
ncbi:secretory phospholipase A2 receptor [Oncorhynchus tshawytscha]|uniref:C-type lectin domain-containing protein n=1 Tax=Oncorhynchus tshawytscha TaxID=74940 RepID=A0A8C8BUI8_ONCTS|nr:secretory phospholipase A2 receptor [Oncorhynchus tshawytscha]